MRPTRREIRKVRRWGESEGKRLAKRVRRGEFTRADVEQARREYPNDGEPIVALEWLDRWGIR